MIKYWKRFLSMALCAALLFGMLPTVTAFAEEETESVAQETEATVQETEAAVETEAVVETEATEAAEATEATAAPTEETTSATEETLEPTEETVPVETTEETIPQETVAMFAVEEEEDNGPMTQEEFLEALGEADGSYELTRSVYLSESVSIFQSLTVGAGCELVVTNGASVGLYASTTLSGDGSTLRVDSGSTLWIASGAGVNVNSNGYLCVQGILICDGSIAVGSGGSFWLEGGEATINGSLTNQEYLQVGPYGTQGTLNVDGTMENAGYLAVGDNGTLDVSGTLVHSGYADILGNTVISGSLTGPGSMAIDGNVEVYSGGALEVTAPGELRILDGGFLSAGGSLHSAGGSSVAIEEGGALWVQLGGTATIDGSLTNQGALHAGYNDAPGTLNVNGTLENAGYVSVGSNGNLNMNGTLTNTSGKVSIEGAAYVSGTLTNADIMHVVGTAEVLPTGKLNVMTSGSIKIPGYLSVAGGLNGVSGSSIDVWENGALWMQGGGTATIDGSLTNEGFLHVGTDTPGRLDVNGTLINKGYLQLPETGVLNVAGTMYNEEAAGSIWPFVDAYGPISVSGTLENKNAITLAPGASLQIQEGGAYTGSGDLTVYAEEQAAMEAMVPGLKLADYDQAEDDGENGHFWLLRKKIGSGEGSITLDQEYITMVAGDSQELPNASVIPASWSSQVEWHAENLEGTEVISVENGAVTAVNPGTAYIVATVDITGNVFSARCRVDVQAADVEVLGVQLGTDKANVELYSSQYTAIDAVILLEQNLPSGAMSVMSARSAQNTDVSITSARFEDAAAAASFTLEARDDRTLLVVPTQDAIDNPASVKSSYTSKVIVTVGGTEFTAEGSVKLTVKKTLPKLKAENLTFNPFFTNQSQKIAITGATVTGIEEDIYKATAKAPAIPDWLQLNPNDGTLTLKDAPKSGSGKANLLVETKEWVVPIPVAVSVKLSYKAPGLKLSASSVTIGTYTSQDDGGNSYSGAYLELLCKNKGDTLEGLGVSEIEAPDGWYAWTDEVFPTEGNNYFTLFATAMDVKPGKITLKVHFYGTEGVVELPLTIKTKETPFKISTYTEPNIKLSSATRDSFYVNWWFDRYIDMGENDEVRWTFRDKKGNPVPDTYFEVEAIHDPMEAYRVLTTESTQAGTYEMALDLYRDGVRKTEESAIVKFTVLPLKTKPSMTIKVLDALDLTASDPRARISDTVKNYVDGSYIREEVFLDARGNDVSDLFTIDFYNDGNEWGYEIKPSEGEEIPTGTYTLKWYVRLGARPEDAIELGYPVEAATKFTVKRTPVKLKLSKSSMTLNPFIGDQATVDVTCQTKDYDFTEPIIKVMDGKGKASAEGCLDVSYNGGKLTVGTNGNTEAGSSYRILVQAREVDAPATLTVKTLAQGKAAVSVTLKAKGTIDPIRDGTSAVITPTYKNYMGEAELSKTAAVWASKDGKNYTEDVTSSFQIVENGDGTYTVAKVPGEQLDITWKYRFQMSFPDVSDSKEGYLVLPVKSGSAKVTQGADAVLYKKDRNSRADIVFNITDETLNPIADVRIKDAKMAALYELYDYGNGQYGIGFKDNTVASGVKSGSVALEIYFDGNASGKPNATLSLKLQIK